MKSYPDTFITLDELGSRIPAYRPTCDYQGSFIDDFHHSLAHCPVKDEVLIQLSTGQWFRSVIPGWLRREEALKLYEMAYCVVGDILELGPYRGLSTSILSQANQHSPHRKTIYSVDLSPVCVWATKWTLRRGKLYENVIVMWDDALEAVRKLATQGKRFDFIFVDHAHTYEAVYNLCRELGTILSPGGFCLFHDFNDCRNRDPEDHEYGVYQAVTAGLQPPAFEFYGVFGCAGLYRAAMSGA